MDFMKSVLVSNKYVFIYTCSNIETIIDEKSLNKVMVKNQKILTQRDLPFHSSLY